MSGKELYLLWDEANSNEGSLVDNWEDLDEGQQDIWAEFARILKAEGEV